MKLRVRVDIDVDVPETAVVGGATPSAIAEKARVTLQERISAMFSPWGNRVDVYVNTGPDPKAKG